MKHPIMNNARFAEAHLQSFAAWREAVVSCRRSAGLAVVLEFLKGDLGLPKDALECLGEESPVVGNRNVEFRLV